MSNYSGIEEKQDSAEQLAKLLGVPSVFKVTAAEWNTIRAKLNHLKQLIELIDTFSGAYADLSGKPDLSIYALESKKHTGIAIEDASLTGTVQLDLDTFDSFLGTLTGDVTINSTILNLPASGETVVKTLEWQSTSGEGITIPASWHKIGAYNTDGSFNVMSLNISHYPTSGVKITLTISH